MKILFVNESSGFYGGLEQYIYSISKVLVQKGHQNILISSKKQGKNSESFGQYFSRQYQIEFSRSSRTDHELLRKIVKQENPDVAYIHKMPNSKLIQEINQLLPTVRMIHDVQPFCLSARKYHYFSDRLCDRKIGIGCYRFPGCYQLTKTRLLILTHGSLWKTKKELIETFKLDKIIVASSYMKKELATNGCENERIAILPLFIEQLNSKPIEKTENRNSILYIGNIYKGKGLDLLLKSLKLVSHDYNLIVMGDGKSKAKYKLLANKLGIASKIKNPGWISHAEMECYYQKTALVVMPSRWPEPFGLVGLEAMAHGVPVVAFNVGGIPDWLEDGKNGLLVERGNIQQLAEKIELLLTDQNLNRKLGEYGRQCVMTKYNAEDYVKKLLLIFEQAIQKRCGA